jgi:hypothetical protein
MAGTVNLTMDGVPVETPLGTLLIEAAKVASIEIPSVLLLSGPRTPGRLPYVPG